MACLEDTDSERFSRLSPVLHTKKLPESNSKTDSDQTWMNSNPGRRVLRSFPSSTGRLRWYQEYSAAEKLQFVRCQAQRISRMISAKEEQFSVQECRSIQFFLDTYAARVNSKKTQIWSNSTNTLLERAAVSYAPEIIAAFEAENIPPQIGLYLAMVESEYHECLTSPVGAKGMFQFMPATARQYGLSPDERCDWKKSAQAAAKYMKDRLLQFGVDGGSVTLAIAGYNRGPQSVMRDVTQVLDQSSDARTFWTLADQNETLDRYFNQENIKYVPKFFAAAIIGENPWAFGIELAALSTYRTQKSNAEYSKLTSG